MATRGSYQQSGEIPGVVADLVMTGSAFNDAANEFICNVLPAPATHPGFTAVAGNCFDPTTAAPSMTWDPLTAMSMEYGSAAGVSGGALVQFSSAIFGGALTWATNLTNMAVGERRVSNIMLNGEYAVLTYLSGPPPSPSGTIRMEGGAVIGLHRLNTSIVAPIRFNLAFYAS